MDGTSISVFDVKFCFRKKAIATFDKVLKESFAQVPLYDNDQYFTSIIVLTTQRKNYFPTGCDLRPMRSLLRSTPHVKELENGDMPVDSAKLRSHSGC